MKNNVLLVVALVIILVLSFSTGYYYHKSKSFYGDKKAWRSKSHRGFSRGMHKHKKFFNPEFHKQMEAKRRELFEELRKEPNDTAALSKRIEEMNEIQHKIQKEITAHILKKLDSLHGEKREKFLKRLERPFGRGMGPRHGPGHRHGRGLGHGPDSCPESPPPHDR
jgi:DNA anti-recombination protein RmuC